MLQAWISPLFLSLIGLTWPFLTGASIAKHGCATSCGNVTIRYPFGVGRDGSCSMSRLYDINCNTSFNPPRPFLMGYLEILDVSQEYLRVKHNVMSSTCYNRGKITSSITGSTLNLTNTPFSISDTENRFVVVGCEDVGLFEGTGDNNRSLISGCVALCLEKQDMTSGLCLGSGCCQVTIPNRLKTFDTAVAGIYNHTNVSFFNPCSHAFLAEQDKFIFNVADLSDPTFENRTKDSVPVVLDWVVGLNQTCQQAKKNASSYACQGNTTCNDTNLGGYRCSCLSGYQGNPYLSPGCTDINECEGLNNPCIHPHTCVNVPSTFRCSCPKGHHGDGLKKGVGCISNNSNFALRFSLGVGFGILLLLMFISWLYFIVRRRKAMKMREKFFSLNGGILMKQKLSPSGDSMDLSKIFTVDELKVATHNYSEDQILGKGGYGTVYKGIMKDGQEVAIKRSKISDISQIEQFINEVVILTQINHRNVVKLLGCCLESEVPMLVYEFISNGTLFEHIHGREGKSRLTWGNCVRLAREAADALAYLHSAASVPIIHRDVKSANILLNESYTAKISDFGASRLIPIDQTQVTTLVQGTLGYLDPEYFITSQLTEKSDVYSFGIVLAELLTREKPLSFERKMEVRNLATYFVFAMEENRVFEIIDPQLASEATEEQVIAMANLIKKCLNIKGKDRPSMKEVARELEELSKQINHPWVEHNNEETTSLISEKQGLHLV